MQNVRWFVRAIAGLDPDAAPQGARLVVVTARYDSAEFDGQRHTAADEFELWIPVELTDVATIECEAYRALREHLAALLSSLPGRWPRAT